MKTKQMWLDEFNARLSEEMIKHITTQAYEFNRVNIVNYISTMLDEVVKGIPTEQKLSSSADIIYGKVICWQQEFLNKSQ